LVGYLHPLSAQNDFLPVASRGVLWYKPGTMVTECQSGPCLIVKTYQNESKLKAATASGTIDIGFILPPDFDLQVMSGNIELNAFIWGASQAKNRAIISSALANDIRKMNGSALPVSITSHPLDQEDDQPWSTRLMPIAILLAVFFGGLMIPAASIINEKNRHTLEAISITPLTMGEIFAAKGIFGILLAAIMGIITLILSGGFIPALLSMLLVLFLGAILAVEFGLLAGALIKDLNTLYALWKFGALILFGPALIYIFPQIPQWIGYLFPTYYVIRPVMDISVNNAALSSEFIYLAVLIFLVLVLLALIRSLTKRIYTGALKIT
jgi:ABC-2 type transport system permease protein